jgi:sugar transferase
MQNSARSPSKANSARGISWNSSVAWMRLKWAEQKSLGRQARREASAALERVRLGFDPAEEKKARRLIALPESDTFALLVQDYLERARRNMAPSTFKEAKRVLDREAVSVWRSRPAASDQLPMLINVLRGEMSIVGTNFYALPPPQLFDQHSPALLDGPFKPGLVSFESSRGSREFSQTDADLFYLSNWSLVLDLKILFRCLFSKDTYFQNRPRA